MNEEELEKEAEEYRESKRHKSFRADVGTVQINYESYLNNLQQAYLAGAEPREKRITELETRCNELFFQVNEKVAKIADLEKENKELKTRLRKKINITTVSDYPYSALKLEEAKEIIREFVDNVERYSINNEILDRAEQFLNSLEK